jgi:hypothetical protein
MLVYVNVFLCANIENVVSKTTKLGDVNASKSFKHSENLLRAPSMQLLIKCAFVCDSNVFCAELLFMRHLKVLQSCRL